MEVSKLPFRDRILAIDPEIRPIPRGYKRIENKIILRYNEALDTNLGQVVLKAYPWCTGVFQHQTTIGENRRPLLRHLAGDQNTVVMHIENATKYWIDIAKITFSGGNSQLRRRLVKDVQPHEKLLDMFAAVGNLSLQILLHNRNEAILVERDPVTYKFLERSILANNITTAQLMNIDCRNLELENWADRIFMGYHEVDESHIRLAIKAAKEKAKLHLHPIVMRGQENVKQKEYREWFDSVETQIIDITTRKIKNYSPKLDHIEIVLTIEK